MTESTNSTNPTNAVKQNWTELKGKLKAKFPVLTDADLQYADGKKDEMMGKIQQKIGKTKQELSEIISSL